VLVGRVGLSDVVDSDDVQVGDYSDRFLVHVAALPALISQASQITGGACRRDVCRRTRVRSAKRGRLASAKQVGMEAALAQK
jgi:hypothetical protein